MSDHIKIAFIPPIGKSDYLANTIIDGILWLKLEGKDIELALPAYEYPCPYDILPYKISDDRFTGFADAADLIILAGGKNATNHALAEKIGRWDKTVFIDGSEPGKDRRYDPKVQADLRAMTYVGYGAIDSAMLSKCALYFRREKPYLSGIVPLPFGIESRYIEGFNPKAEKDIDFSCIFGQEDYPALRKQARKYLEKFCRKNGFTCETGKTRGFDFDDDRKLAGRQAYYDILRRSKVGVSIGGGGFDTARFWEILGNGCLLMTETIDIYGKAPESGDELDYSRIWQFRDIAEFEDRLGEVAAFLKNGYDSTETRDVAEVEYRRIIEAHSSKARVIAILEAAKKKDIIKIQ